MDEVQSHDPAFLEKMVFRIPADPPMLKQMAQHQAQPPSGGCGGHHRRQPLQDQLGHGQGDTTYPGRDSLVRAVDVQTETLVQSNKSQDPKQLKTKTHVFRRPITKVALLVPEQAPPDQTSAQQAADS